jgi:hypothetical protein
MDIRFTTTVACCSTASYQMVYALHIHLSVEKQSIS